VKYEREMLTNKYRGERIIERKGEKEKVIK